MYDNLFLVTFILIFLPIMYCTHSCFYYSWWKLATKIMNKCYWMHIYILITIEFLQIKQKITMIWWNTPKPKSKIHCIIQNTSNFLPNTLTCNLLTCWQAEELCICIIYISCYLNAQEQYTLVRITMTRSFHFNIFVCTLIPHKV